MALPTLVSSKPAAASKQHSGVSVEKLEQVLKRFEITIVEANDLTILQDYEIVIIADDSGSMDNPSLPPSLRKLGVRAPSRWEELQSTVSNIVDIAVCFDESGVDLYFLNREPVLSVKSSTEARFLQSFAAPPDGTTPLTETLERVAARSMTERPVLLFILTDGEPNGGPDPFKAALMTLIAPNPTSGRKLRTQLMVCTPLEDEVRWLNDLDRDFVEVDVTDDYHTEQSQILASGRAPQFTRGDWCMKAMLGPVSHKFDMWDEKKRTMMEEVRTGDKPICASCTVQ